ncbi:N-terminal phage integrase SAM-like domain-containing protein [Anaerosinus gibii]|uniref:N-terminal phage integrase SAM-like domain-containing protein n=1 Tax=Selenobaculum gibii TaxID=3054208 RepID=A0A9Y2EVY6_9FIRM|nr:N-terminal phage integrase SAM-like domain-containing protein [Selenobaculum gbiensis]WIW71884.1 N-terminal phage integrase SAM-like domain-containing protein [Selenobaculum gbiensis]
MKGSVRKRGGIWYYRINLGIIDNERKETERAVGTSEKEVWKALRQAMVDIDQTGRYFDPSSKSFSDYLDEFIESRELNLKEYTLIRYKSAIKNHLKPALGKYKIKNISPALIQKFIDSKKREGFSQNTTLLIFAVLRKALKYAVQLFGYIKINPKG